MKKVIAILLTVVLMCGVVACASIGEWNIGKYLGSIQVLASEENPTGNIMGVFYTLDEGRVLFWCTNFQITDNGDGTWDVEGKEISVSGVNQATAGYSFWKYQSITTQYDEDGNPLPIYMDDLNLQPVEAGDLPHSEHVGILTAVNPALAKPATVTRKWMGQNFNVKCFVTQTIVDMWVADTLNVGDYVLVSFIEENPNGTERNIAIVTDKVFNSWD